jgi:hypothetical protein
MHQNEQDQRDADRELDRRIVVLRRRIVRSLQVIVLASAAALLEAGALWAVDVAPAAGPALRWALQAIGALEGPEVDEGAAGGDETGSPGPGPLPGPLPDPGPFVTE